MAGNWTKQQLQAIETDNCNILVSAAAGSGKTAVLVRRIIRKITDKDNPVDIDRMVVVTFTKAAAAEMKQRIRDALDELIQEEPDSELLQRQLTLINNAHISTIDSFCLNIVRNHFADIDMDPSFRAADENEIKLLEQDVMEEMIEEYYAKEEQEFFDLVDSYGTGRDDTKLIEMISKIYKYARSFPWEDEWYDNCLADYDVKSVDELQNSPAIKYLWNDIKSKISDYKYVYERLVEICNSPDGPAMYLGAIQSDMAGMNMMLEAESFERFVKLVELLSFDTLGRGGKKEVNEEKKEYVKSVRDDYKGYMTKTVKGKMLFQSVESCLADMQHNFSAVRMMITLAKDFSARMREEKRSRNIIDFNDMEHMALNILVKRQDDKYVPTEVADALRDYYQEIMIDEYQDSNMLQEVILSAISRTEPYGNMYMVGDVKQSIYKFRLACPELFIGKYDSYERDKADNTKNYLIELQNNFRSRSSVLDASNDVFMRLMNPQYCHIDYNDDVKLNAGLEYPESQSEVLKDGVLTSAVDFGKSPEVDIYLVPTEDEDADKKELEAAAIADVIEELFTGDVRMVYDRSVEGGYRPIKYSDIVILGRAIKHGWAEGIVNTLLNRGIPAFADAGDGYFSVREIQVILSFLKIIDNPLQDIPMAAVMLSYFGNFSAEELAVIRGKRTSENLYVQLQNLLAEDEAREPLRTKVDTFVKRLNRYREKSQLMSVRDLIWTVMYETGYYDYVGTMPAAERRQANLDVLLEKAAGYESTSYTGLFNFLRYIERMQKFDADTGEASVLGEQDNLVRVMTIHKSKGLEFPVVILSGMGKKINKNDAKQDVLFDQELGIGTSVVYLDKRVKRQTLARTAIASKLVADSISEEMRVLYVAMTRAREKLIITGTVKNAEAADKWQVKARELQMSGRFTYTDISKFDKYFDMFMPVAYMDSECNTGKFNVMIKGGDAESNVVDAAGGVSDADETTADASDVADAAGDASDALQDTRSDHLQASGLISSNVSKETDVVEIPLYPYPINNTKKAKVTVSELKSMQMDADFAADSMVADGVCISEPKNDKSVEEAGSDADADAMEGAEATEAIEAPKIIPRFLRVEEEKLAGNERGTAYHRIMECLDYSSLDDNGGSLSDCIRQQIDDMLEAEKISKAQADVISVEDIVTFCTSDIGRRVKSAADSGKLWREQPFVFIDKEIDETQLIQGVIDLYLVDDEGITIVDYKTDRVKRGDAGAQELVKRYKVQLDYYGKALSQLTGLPVKEKVIYSFTLGRQIEV